MPLRTDDFDFQLPAELIAQAPVEPRDASRLLVLHRNSGGTEHTRFRDLGRFLRRGDLLVANESRVLQARLFGRKETGGVIELLLLRRRDTLAWEALVRGKGIVPGVTLRFGPDERPLAGRIVESLPHGGRLIVFDQPVEPRLPELGVMPLPPYIRAALGDSERYQTVYSQTTGSAAAPTAGLHFTPALIAQLRASGVEWTTVTLHVGLDTFRPVQVDDVTRHTMHSEQYELPAVTADALNRARAEGRRIVAVGTTTVRVLETAGQQAEEIGGLIQPTRGDTRIFIYPPYRFHLVDGLITNFHLPRSTLLMLVSALASREHILSAYAEAIHQRYRFFSFGDAMLIV
ncbi:MAG TPA: tRNA preQ1(34) S-adenosylmethionine ribosyltransferase-isomerase QueA [Herpetosiphonaceae bacterium]|nr:tRNA preQ1(34) S-adenosylmethionine ribosyltransferase-isomerase QueA [Herpetosiphonaceae bacterium]